MKKNSRFVFGLLFLINLISCKIEDDINDPNEKLYGFYDVIVGVCNSKGNDPPPNSTVLIVKKVTNNVTSIAINDFYYSVFVPDLNGDTVRSYKTKNLMLPECEMKTDSVNIESFFWGSIINRKNNKIIGSFRRGSVCSPNFSDIIIEMNYISDDKEVVKGSVVKRR
jgi:hypothetical protein